MDLKALIRVIPDFPKPGIRFKDITTLLKDGGAWRETVDRIADQWRHAGVDVIVGPEARGFALGASVAYALGAGFVPVRKAGKLPAESIRGEYALEYGKDSLEMHTDALKPGQSALIVDDLLATGGTLKTCVDLVERLGGTVAGVAVMIELTYLEGRRVLEGHAVTSLIQF